MKILSDKHNRVLFIASAIFIVFQQLAYCSEFVAPPKVVIVVNSTEPLVEDKSVTLWCYVDGRRERDLHYMWRKDGQILYIRSQGYVIQSLSSEIHNGKNFSCEVSTADGRQIGTGHLTLRVLQKG